MDKDWMIICKKIDNTVISISIAYIGFPKDTG